MKLPTFLLASVLALATVACSKDSPTTTPTTDEPTAPTGTTVQVVDNAFEPATVTIAAGSSVSWTWDGTSAPHNVVADDASFDSGDPDATGNYSYTFPEAGTFTYACDVHKSLGMTGTVTVT